MMSRSRLASRSLSRDLETSLLVIVFLRMSGMGNGSSRFTSSGLFLFSSCSVFFLPNRSMSVSSVKGAVWPFLRNRSIPQRSLSVEGCRIINGLAERRALCYRAGWLVRPSIVI
jgi:hypothetical protein